MDSNVVMVATSNRSPDTLYEGGLNRSLFLPFIDMLKDTSDIISMESSHKDYRRENRADGQSYFWSNTSNLGGLKNSSNILSKLNDLIDEENKLKINEKIKVFLNKSALAGDKLAIVQIAKWNLQLSPEPNFENAYKWYNIAVALGIKTAKIKRDEMIENIEKQRLFEIQKESIKIFDKINSLGG